MKRLFRYPAITIIVLSFSLCAKAQAPDISYNPATNVYTVGTAITSLSPTNNGGSVPNATYATVNVYAGSTAGTTGRTNSGTLTTARFSGPRGLTIESDGTIYIADYTNNEIRKISPSTGVTLLAGSTAGTAGRTNGTGTNARFSGPYAITHDNSGNLFVADYTNNEIRKIDESTGAVTLFAGATNGGTGRTNGNGTTARFRGPAGIVYDPVNDVFYIADYTNNEIRKMTPAGDVSLFAGNTNATSGSTDGTGTNARFNGPAAIAVDASGNVYVADQNNNKIRMITPAGVVTTFAGSGTSGSTDGTGTSARFRTPQGLTVDISGNIYVSDTGNDLIRMITPAGVVTTIAGSGNANLTNGVGTIAEFDANRGIAYDFTSGNLYVTDYNNNDIRKVIATGYTVSPDLPTGLSLNGATGVITGTPTATSSATDYTITAFNVSGSSSTTVNIACGETIYWRGMSNTRWDRTNNWSTNSVPTANDAVEIGVTSTFTNQPAVSNADAVARSITFGNKKDATLTISSGRTLTISGGITINTTVTPTITGAGDVTMSPGSVITISGTGTLTIDLSGNFTLQSDATGSASISVLSNATAINGTGASSINVQRYFTGGSNTYRGYRLVSSPVYQGTVSSNHVFNLDFLKASALITGISATGGFDHTGNPTLYLFRQDQAVSNSTFTGGNYWGISAINNSPTYNLYLNGGTTNYNLPAGNGVLFFFRGDNINNLANKYTTTTSAESVTFTSTGTLNMGQVTVKDWYTPTSQYLDYTSVTGNISVRGFNLAGNPYPSNIDWDTFQTSSSTTGIYGSNVSSSVYVLDPVSKNFGVYTAGDPSQTGTNGATNVIASGQGFFVKAGGANPQLIFNESAKTSSQVTGPNLLLGKAVNYTNNQYLHLKMIKDAVNTDELMIRFDSRGSSNYVENMDAVYKQGYGAVSLSSLSGDKVKLAINVIPLPKQQAENISLSVDATASGTYKLTLKDIVSVPNLYDVWLMDSYKNDSLDMRRNQFYTFNIDKSDSASFGPGRFTLVMRQNPAYTYKLLDFTASKVSDTHQAQIVWNTANEGNYTYFTVERSINNGNSFEVLGGVTAAGAGTYSILDKSPVNGQNIYRLKQVDINNITTYSKPASVEFSDLSNKKLLVNNLGIFPNPVVNNTINLVINTRSTEDASYKIRFMNSSGIVVKEVISSQASWQGNLSNLQPGVYMVHVINNKTNTDVGESKFVKL